MSYAASGAASLHYVARSLVASTTSSSSRSSRCASRLPSFVRRVSGCSSLVKDVSPFHLHPHPRHRRRAVLLLSAPRAETGAIISCYNKWFWLRIEFGFTNWGLRVMCCSWCAWDNGIIFVWVWIGTSRIWNVGIDSANQNRCMRDDSSCPWLWCFFFNGQHHLCLLVHRQKWGRHLKRRHMDHGSRH